MEHRAVVATPSGLIDQLRELPEWMVEDLIRDGAKAQMRRRITNCRERAKFDILREQEARLKEQTLFLISEAAKTADWQVLLSLAK